MSTLPLAALFAALVDAALKGSLVLLAALAATRLMKRRSAAARHLVWVVALASMLALPLVSRMLPAWRVLPVPAPLRPAAAFVDAPLAVSPPAAQPQSSAPAAAAKQPTPSADPTVSTPTTPSVAAPAASRPFDWKQALMGLWIAGAALLVVRLAYGMGRVWWMQRSAVEITDEGWVGITDSLARRLRVGRMVTLLRESTAVVPMTWGIVRPVVLLPADAESWDGERRTVVLAHELAHVRRWDTATQWIAHAAIALFWFNPLVWMAARRMREEREHACDDAVLSIGTVPVRYADHLLDIVRSLGAAEGPAAALAMARRSQFEGRLLAILDGATPRGGVSRGLGFAALVAAAAAVLPLGALRAAHPTPAATVETATIAPESSGKPEWSSLATIVGKVGSVLDFEVDEQPVGDTAVKLSFREPGTTNSALPSAPAPPPVSADKGSVDAVASALNVNAARAAALLRDTSGYGDVIRAAASIGSSPERASVLLAVLRRPSLSNEDLAALLRVAGAITSGPEKRDVLRAVASRYSLADATVRRAFFNATSSFVSSPERRDVLLAVLARGGGPEVVTAVIVSARTMSSQPERSDVLLKAIERASGPRELSEVVLAARELSSSPIRRDLLVKVLGRPGLPPTVLREVLQAAAEISSSPEKRDVLEFAASHQRIEGAAREAYLTAANSITSSSQRVDALTALLGPQGATERVPVSSTREAREEPTWDTDLSLTGDTPPRAVEIRARRVIRGREADDIRGIRPGGSIMIQETKNGQTRRADWRPGSGGGITRSYRVDGRTRAWDAEAQRWFSGILREFTRSAR